MRRYNLRDVVMEKLLTSMFDANHANYATICYHLLPSATTRHHPSSTAGKSANPLLPEQEQESLASLSHGHGISFLSFSLYFPFPATFLSFSAVLCPFVGHSSSSSSSYSPVTRRTPRRGGPLEAPTYC